MEYVSKKEVKPWRAMFHKWMKNIRTKVKEKGITFTYRLVGSAKRNLVLRHHNKGFDCDYQIFIQRNSNKLSPKEIKLLFKSVIDEVCVSDSFEPCENSTSSLTIKMVDKAQSKVNVGYDVVILQETEEGLKILRCQNKGTKKETFVFELLPDMTNMSAKLAKIKGKKQCDKLRERYCNKKTNYNGEKKSFQLLNEAINEVLQLK